MKKVLVVLLVLIILAGSGAGYYYWYQNAHIFIDEAVYDKDATYLDLTGTGISLEHYEQLRQQLPDCEIIWDVPFQGGSYSNTSKSLTVTDLTEADMYRLVYFPKLERIDASGCGNYTMLEFLRSMYPELEVSYLVDLGGMKFDPDTTALTLEEGTYDYDQLMLNLVHLPRVTKLALPRTSLSKEQLEEIRFMYPGISLSFSVVFRGEEVDPGVTELDLSDLTSEEVAQVAQELSFFHSLESVQLMNAEGKSNLSLVDVQTLQEASPGTTFHYSFSFYNQTLSTTDVYVEYRNKYMKDRDEEQIRQILDVMDSCETFIFNNCHISNDVMSSIREDYRDRTKIVWRVFFGNAGSCLTDREVIKMVYGLTNANAAALKYCEDARFIDFGHNESLTDISFVAHMPNLEAIILSGSPIRSLEPFAGHKNIYFLELAYCGYISDLTPLKDCTNLGMLNLSYSAVTDLSPIDNLPLERLTFVHTEVPDEEIERYCALNPDCWVVHEGPQPYGKGWRYDEDGSQSEYYKKLASPEIFNYKNTHDTNW